jgi:hypothetical protein
MKSHWHLSITMDIAVPRTTSPAQIDKIIDEHTCEGDGPCDQAESLVGGDLISFTWGPEPRNRRPKSCKCLREKTKSTKP